MGQSLLLLEEVGVGEFFHCCKKMGITFCGEMYGILSGDRLCVLSQTIAAILKKMDQKENFYRPTLNFFEEVFIPIFP